MLFHEERVSCGACHRVGDRGDQLGPNLSKISKIRQPRDLLEAMISDWSGGDKGGVLRVDGGMSASDWTMQFLSNILNAPVDRPEVLETTAMGAAWLAGMHAGVYPEQNEFSKSWSLEKRFQPDMDNDLREQRYKDWKSAVAATLEVRT